MYFVGIFGFRTHLFIWNIRNDLNFLIYLLQWLRTLNFVPFIESCWHLGGYLDTLLILNNFFKHQILFLFLELWFLFFKFPKHPFQILNHLLVFQFLFFWLFIFFWFEWLVFRLVPRFFIFSGIYMNLFWLVSYSYLVRLYFITVFNV